MNTSLCAACNTVQHTVTHCNTRQHLYSTNTRERDDIHGSFRNTNPIKDAPFPLSKRMGGNLMGKNSSHVLVDFYYLDVGWGITGPGASCCIKCKGFGTLLTNSCAQE